MALPGHAVVNWGSLPHVSWLQVLLLGTTMTDPMFAAKPAELSIFTSPHLRDAQGTF